MRAIVLTVFISLILAGIFVVLFLHERLRRGVRSVEQDSLLPFSDETPRKPVSAKRVPESRNCCSQNHE